MSRFASLGLLAAAGLALSGCQFVRDDINRTFGHSPEDQTRRVDHAASQVTTIGVNAYLWRAALDTLSFAPLAQTDSNGGVIVTEWYANPQNPSERAKVTVVHPRPGPPGRRAPRHRGAADAAGRAMDRRAGDRGDRSAARGDHPDPRPRPQARRDRRLRAPNLARNLPRMASRFNPLKADAHWQKVWDERGTFRARDDSARPKAYVLEMFPYPSGRIHMGHVRNYTMGDVLARYRRMNGLRSAPPDGLGRVRHAGRECGDGARGPSRRVDPRQYRDDARPAEAARLRARLEPRARHLRARLLRPGAGAVPRPLRGRPGLSQGRARSIGTRST